MDLTFSSKSQEFELDGSVKGTKVVLSNDEGAIYPVMLEPDKIDLTNTELEKLALDVIYQKNFRDKYENEKFAEMQAGLAKQKESSEIAQATLLDVVTQLYDKGVLTDEIIEEN
ncbi:hypothetical protein Javan284_0007 [Streptococcus phage Javan284]|uniref:DUF1366 domain-containing protein n=1 Tax=Streptococcus lutetiensis 033 TaxID=1076934 RepID=A0AB33AMN2_9STRE|nr:DUF1366 domain-containing protein [Streptococcus lutetiensis]AGS05863.1 hypothetical protein KE3_1388 [Streptococcus lutetiensis 033]QBX25959.1 hypothetical protein Javan284_0007 [Streptococcus phage Javan284]